LLGPIIIIGAIIALWSLCARKGEAGLRCHFIQCSEAGGLPIVSVSAGDFPSFAAHHACNRRN
jgi:hypothetical protein